MNSAEVQIKLKSAIQFFSLIILICLYTPVFANTVHYGPRMIVYRVDSYQQYYYEIQNYDGEVDSMGLPDGKGKIVYKNLYSYEGEICRGLMCGKGIFINENYNYEGVFDKDGMTSGKIFQNNGTLVFEGTCRNSMPYRGVFYTENVLGTIKIILEGEFSDGELTGYGKKYHIYKDKDTADLFNLTAKFLSHSNDKGSIFKPGIKYLIEEGNFKGNELEGNGKKYAGIYINEEGEFKNKKLNGYGKKYDGKYLAEEGTYINGILNGKGKKYSGGNIAEEGIYNEDVLHGKGMLYKDGRIIFDGYFWKGDPIDKPARIIVDSKNYLSNISVSDYQLSKDQNQITVVPEKDITLKLERSDYITRDIPLNLEPGEVRSIDSTLEYDRVGMIAEGAPFFRIGYGGSFLGPAGMLNIQDDEARRYYPEGHAFFADLFISDFVIDYVYLGALFRLTYREYDFDNKMTHNTTWTQDKQQIFSFDTGVKWSIGTYLLFFRCDFFIGANLRLYAQNKNNDKTINENALGGVVGPLGIVGLAGIEIAPFENMGFFVEYNYGYSHIIPFNSGINIEGHQIYFGATLRAGLR